MKTENNMTPNAPTAQTWIALTTRRPTPEDGDENESIYYAGYVNGKWTVSIYDVRCVTPTFATHFLPRAKLPPPPVREATQDDKDLETYRKHAIAGAGSLVTPEALFVCGMREARRQQSKQHAEELRNVIIMIDARTASDASFGRLAKEELTKLADGWASQAVADDSR